MIQILNLYHEGEFQDFFCPICGQKADVYEDCCPHQTFVYTPEGGSEFEYCSNEFEPVVLRIQKEIDDLEVLSDQDGEDVEIDEDKLYVSTHLESLPASHTAFIIRVTTTGGSCGPDSNVCYYGFDAVNGADDPGD
jgi:hypothetical protein